MEDVNVKYNNEKYINHNINPNLNNENVQLYNEKVYSKQVLNKLSSKGGFKVYSDGMPATIHGTNNYQKKHHLLYEKHNLGKDHHEGSRHSYSVNVGKVCDENTMNRIMKTGQQEKFHHQMNIKNNMNPSQNINQNMIYNNKIYNVNPKNSVNLNKNSRYEDEQQLKENINFNNNYNDNINNNYNVNINNNYNDNINNNLMNKHNHTEIIPDKMMGETEYMKHPQQDTSNENNNIDIEHQKKQQSNDTKSIRSVSSKSSGNTLKSLNNPLTIPSITNIYNNLIDKKNSLYLKNYMNNVYNNEKEFHHNSNQPVLLNSDLPCPTLHLNKNKNHSSSSSTAHSLYNKITSLKKIATNNNNDKDSINDNSSANDSSNAIIIKISDEDVKEIPENYNNKKDSIVFIPKSTCDSGILTDVIIHDKEKQRKAMDLLKQNSSNEFSSYLQKKYGKSKSDLNNDFLLEHEDEIFNNKIMEKKHELCNKEQSIYISELLDTIPNNLKSVNIDTQKNISTTDSILADYHDEIDIKDINPTPVQNYVNNPPPLPPKSEKAKNFNMPPNNNRETFYNHEPYDTRSHIIINEPQYNRRKEFENNEFHKERIFENEASTSTLNLYSTINGKYLQRGHSKDREINGDQQQFDDCQIRVAVETLKHEIDKLSPPSAATKRKCMMAQVYFLEYYFDILTYINHRKNRTEQFKQNAIKNNLSQEEYNQQWKQYCGKERAFLRKRRIKTKVEQFHLLTQVGQGGYGQVFLARKKDTGEICALKQMSKKKLLRNNEIQHVLTERDILTATNSPWLVKLLYAFQDYENVYLAMEFVPGGDVRTLLNKSGVLLEVHTKFYISEMFIAVNSLHELGYIHRDLKPENFLIDANGHIKLTDFGLSRGSISTRCINSLRSKLDDIKDKHIIPRTIAERRTIHESMRKEKKWAFSLVGSPDYIAPEILDNNGYDYLVDYWSLGCILFEFLSGYPPFTAPTMDEIWLNVYKWKEVLERPVYEGEDEEFNLSDEAWDLITRLITDRSIRMSSLFQVQAHPFFCNDIKFKDLRTKKGAKPPFVPELESDIDTTYFDDFSDPKDLLLYKDIIAKQELENKETDENIGESREGSDISEFKNGILNKLKNKNVKQLFGIGSDNKKNKQAMDPEDEELRREFIGFTYRHKDFKH